jgi:hypothetical protein
MAFSNDGLQVQEYVYDFSVDGGATGAIDLSAKAGYDPLPDGAIVSEVVAFFEAAIVGTSSTLSWGNTADPDGYSGSAIAEATLVINYVANGFDNGAALLWDDTNDHKIHYLANATNKRDFSVTIGTADLTAGKVKFMVAYYLPS